MGTTSSPPPATVGPGTGPQRRRGGGGRCDAAAAGADVPPAATASITSFFVIRPPVPLPEICDRSRWCSSASFRTRGERICDRGPRSGNVDAATGAGVAGALAGGVAAEADPGAAAPTASAATGSCAAAEWSAAAAAPEASPSPDAAPSPESTSANAVPTATVVPSATRIFVTVPDDRRRHLGVDLVRRQLEERLVDRRSARPPASATSRSCPRRSSRRAGASGSTSPHRLPGLTMRRGGRPPPRSRTPAG